jgi:hypothetical protein
MAAVAAQPDTQVTVGRALLEVGLVRTVLAAVVVA